MTRPTFDAIVVGGGSVGVPCAYHLAKRGLKVLVLERCPAVGQGQNKAAIGGIRATHSDPAKIVLCNRSLAEMTTWKARTGVDVGWKPGGYAYPVYDEPLERELRGLFPIQRKFDLNIDWLDAAAMAELIPGIERRGLRGGTYSPGDGQLSPLKVSVAFQRAAQALGAEFRFNERVEGYRVEAGLVRGVVTDKGEHAAGAVVIAAGAEAAEHGRLLGIDIPVQPDSHEAGITAPVAPFLAPLVVDMRPGPEGKTANFYFGQNDEGQIIFCYTPKELFYGVNRESTSEFLPILAARMITLIPRMRNLLVRRVWRGLYPMTPDGTPIIDNVPEIGGLALAVGMCGQGFMLGPGVGQEIAALVVDGATSLPAEAHDRVRYGRNFAKAGAEALK
ncbi:MAG: FAD-binding oxidoreductase [Proteobacteria bacterium]|jgi:sarcosine oxidase subunit beta|nr:FAD-binding oxidoreductase [Pseudomonadota bacterium]